MQRSMLALAVGRMVQACINGRHGPFNYILWKRGAPRSDLHPQHVLDKARALRRAGLVAGGNVTCDIKYVVDFFDIH